jgi:3-phenylpropionate/trans-cinnamate dioxygenase ferredoxin reductase subunit
MKRYDYLIIGGGMAAAAAVKGIRELDGGGSIGIVGSEPDPPYARPPLSKGLWRDKPLDSIWMEVGGAELLLDREVRELQASSQSLLCADGTRLGYGRLLVATGSRPRRLGVADEAIVYLRGLRDYKRLRSLCAPGRRALVLGGGFIGSEISAALAMNCLKVTMLFRGSGLGSAIFPAELSLYLDDYYRGRGVELLPGDSLDSIEAGGGGGEPEWVARSSGGREIAADLVVAGLGSLPNTELASSAGIHVEGGIAVGADLRSSEPLIYSAGDAASFHCRALGGRIRVEHEDNALFMGLAAGRNMAGAGETYDRIPSFYSDLFELGYEAAGELDSSLETCVEWKKPFEKGLVYYLKAGRVRGVLLWNVWRKVEAARALIEEEGPFSASDLAGRIS